jgi:hypothetical protein
LRDDAPRARQWRTGWLKPRKRPALLARARAREPVGDRILFQLFGY